MNKSDTRILTTNHITVKTSDAKKTQSNTEDNTLRNATPAPGPCDDCGDPIVPERPTPNPNRPKRQTDDPEKLIYTNGVQKNGNVVSVKVNPDSTNYMRTSKEGVSIKFLVNKLQCVDKSIRKLKDNIDQLKAEVQPTAITEKIVEQSNEFEINPQSGLLEIKLSGGLGVDGNGAIGVKCDGDTIDFDEQGRIMTVWAGFSSDNE